MNNGQNKCKCNSTQSDDIKCVCSRFLTEEVSADQTVDDKYDFIAEMTDEELDDFVDAQIDWQNEVDRAR